MSSIIPDPSCFLSLSGLYRRKSKQALRDYKKVLVQLETLEINVGDQCRKEFTGMSALHFIFIANTFVSKVIFITVNEYCYYSFCIYDK